MFSLKLNLEEDSSRNIPLPTGLTALVIEDEQEVANLIGEMLSANGVTAQIALSAEEGLEYISGNHYYDFVLSDLKMPGMGGLGLLDILQSERPDLVGRLAFVTGDAMSRDAEQIRSHSSRPLIEKPVSPLDLRRLLGEIAGNRTQ